MGDPLNAVSEAMGLAWSMVASGERHTPTSEDVRRRGRAALDQVAAELVCLREENERMRGLAFVTIRGGSTLRLEPLTPGVVMVLPDDDRRALAQRVKEACARRVENSYLEEPEPDDDPEAPEHFARRIAAKWVRALDVDKLVGAHD